MNASRMLFLDTQILLEFVYPGRPNHVECRVFCDGLKPNETLVQNVVMIELTDILLNSIPA